MNMELKPITHVAIDFDGQVFSLPKPARHHEVIMKIVETTDFDRVPASARQGFLHPDTGSFITRKQAAKVAKKRGQIDKLISPPLLTSEDLW